MLLPARIWMPILIEDSHSSVPESISEPVDLIGRVGVKREVVETDPAPLVAGLEKPFSRLNEYKVSVARSPALSFLPILIRFIS